MQPFPSFPPGDQFNIGYLCSDWNCDRGLGGKRAMRYISVEGERRDYTYDALREETNRFANVLESLGYRPGEILFVFLPKIPEQYISILGALKGKVVVCPLFSNLGEEGLLDRLVDSRARGIVTRKSYLKKIEAISKKLPDLRERIVVDIEDHRSEGVLSFPRLMRESSGEYQVSPTSDDCPSILHYTSGSTGKPKGVQHVHGGIRTQNYTTRAVLDVREEDVYWCTADAGWVTGSSYGIIGPWSIGATQVHFGGAYQSEAWFDLLEKERVTVWYTAPTALRMLMREDDAFFRKYDLGALRQISSVGEPLNPEVIHWGRRVLGKDIHDTWFQTETGAIMIANRPGLPIRPGSMGKPIEGIEAAVLSDEGDPLPPRVAGNLCLKSGWPSMFIGYRNHDETYRGKFRKGYYFTGDRAYRDEDGYFWFEGRADDVINTAGHLIGPFEIESVLLEMEEIAEAGVIGAPDPILFEKVVVFVALHSKFTYSPELELKIRLHISNRVSSIATPQDIRFVAQIPKNKSGKILRRVLKAQYLGIDPGDISTMEV